MKKTLMLLAATAMMMLCAPAPDVHAQDAIAHTYQAIQLLTDYPGQGKRHTAYKTPDDFVKTWGADVRNSDEALTHITEAMNQVGDNTAAKKQLDLAHCYAKAREHKEARLSAQGALHYLCQGASDDKCQNVPKFGSYVAP